MVETPDRNELTGKEGGAWRVVTQGSSHILDLDAGTVTRIPGPGRPASVNDRARPLRTLEACRVGDAGRWTMFSDDVMIEFYWHVTSRIRRIEQMAVAPDEYPNPRGPMNRETFWCSVQATWGLHSTDEVLILLGLPADEPTLLRDLRTRGQLLAVERGLEYAYPGFQFTETGVIEPVIPGLIGLAREVDWSQNELIVWLCSPSGYFGGDRPVEHLHETGSLLEKARNAATVEW